MTLCLIRHNGCSIFRASLGLTDAATGLNAPRHAATRRPSSLCRVLFGERNSGMGEAQGPPPSVCRGLIPPAAILVLNAGWAGP